MTAPDTPPRRIQRKRTKGWRMPADAVYVGRPTCWGNPWRVVPVTDHRFPFGDAADVLDDQRSSAGRFERRTTSPGTGAPYWAVQMYRLHLHQHPDLVTASRRWLVGRPLVCWCPPDQPCHADVLLELANPAR